MRISIAQTRPVKGDIESNIKGHLRLIDLAVSSGVEIVIFPELSITGYEPTLAEELATTPDDKRFEAFQKISDHKQITIGIGVPTRWDEGLCISMVIFQPHKPRQLYSKKHLHPDEGPFFVSGQSFTPLIVDKAKIALAFCYEITIPDHEENAINSGAEIYIASVAKSVKGIDKAMERLSEIAQKNSLTVLMSNCVGASDGMECAGKSSTWNNKGLLLGQLNSTSEGILLIDTETQEVSEKTIGNILPLTNA